MSDSSSEIRRKRVPKREGESARSQKAGKAKPEAKAQPKRKLLRARAIEPEVKAPPKIPEGRLRKPSVVRAEKPIPPAADVVADEELEFRLPRVPAFVVSLVLHTFLLLILALWTIVPHLAQPALTIALDTVEVPELSMLQLDPLELEAETPELDTTLPDIEEVVEPEPLESVPLNEGPVVAPTVALDESLAAPAPPSDAPAKEVGKMASFYGAKAKGKKFVFVVDNSNSMTGGRFESAIQELIKTVEGLSKDQSFYVLFFSDTMYEMFHPRPTRKLVPATDRNKQRLSSWLYNVELCLYTRGEAAMKKAIALKPDAIFILGDGAFTDNTTNWLTRRERPSIPIHCIGMEVKQKGDKQLRAISKATKGTYRKVKVSAAARKAAAGRQLVRNRTRGRVWGVALPKTDNRKMKKKKK